MIQDPGLNAICIYINMVIKISACDAEIDRHISLFGDGLVSPGVARPAVDR